MTVRLTFAAQFVASKSGKTGLTPTAAAKRVLRSTGAASDLSGETLSAVAALIGGVYCAQIADADPTLYEYLVVFTTTDATVDQKDIPAWQTEWDIAGAPTIAAIAAGTTVIRANDSAGNAVAPAATALSTATWTNAKAAFLDVAVSSRSTYAGGAADANIAAVKAKTDLIPARLNRLVIRTDGAVLAQGQLTTPDYASYDIVAPSDGSALRFVPNLDGTYAPALDGAGNQWNLYATEGTWNLDCQVGELYYWLTTFDFPINIATATLMENGQGWAPATTCAIVDAGAELATAEVLAGVGVAVGAIPTNPLTTLGANAPADWLNAAAVKADAVTKIQANLATAAGVTAAVGGIPPAPTAAANAAAVDAALTETHGAGSWQTGTAGGSGDVEVNHNTGGTDALRVTTAEGAGIDGVLIRAYLKTDYDAGTRNVIAQATTGSDGRWETDMMLDSGTYVLTFARAMISIPNATVTVA